MTNREKLMKVSRHLRRATEGCIGGVMESSGITWVFLGFNASHDFYCGVDSQDRLFKRSVGGEEIEENIKEIDSLDDLGYTGHF